MTEVEQRARIVEICQRMYRQGFIAAADGNVSVRLGRDRLLVTPSGYHKGFLCTGDLVVTDLAGQRLGGRNRPTSELAMHTLVYAARPDVRALVHAHPPMAVALTLAGVSLEGCVLSEACLALGPVPTIPYATPTTAEVPAALRAHLTRANAFVLERHGSLTVGSSLDEAYNRLEILEHTAKILHAAHLLRPVAPLSGADEAKLAEVAARLGIRRAG